MTAQAKIATTTGLNVTTRSRALQDVVWSTAVQHGPSSGLISGVIGELGLAPTHAAFDKALIMAVYGERGRRGADGKLHYFRKSSDTFQDGVAKRFGREVKDALDILAAEQALSSASKALPQPATAETATVVDIAPPAAVAPVVADGAVAAVKRAKIKLSDDDVRRTIEKYGDAEANAEFLGRRKVLIVLRQNTITRQYRKGCYDLLLIVHRQADGSVKPSRMPINTEPAGEYAFDLGNKNRAKYGCDTDREGRQDLGRLVAGTYDYTRQASNFLMLPIPRRATSR
ncbi:hypothetical protein HNO88_003671 [Novosphingobium chloroacetimidivorans]|uniref:Type VI secretion system spike protein VgrG3-like C-terminal domain-containing protein n=1 Tax=Novosphingobium chloroacetimidivorans TaxID=1428314 RepID=A0A7W7KDZ2_9SPHN|nr:hypothetical protein [Novosphingobium chloroacetimidivorans]MBB4860328.1 hypothetical protein [Novosphingobium chloroacetimidivorans]